MMVELSTLRLEYISEMAVQLTGEREAPVVIGRFAPSPTGPLHTGSLVAALGSWLMAKRAGGRWLLRIEDLDTPRVIPGMADDMLRTLDILGLRWDGEVVYQSRRQEAYEAAFRRLWEQGLVYPCGCSRREISAVSSAPHAGDEGPIYPGLCRDGLAEGKVERAFRVRVNGEAITFRDGVMGIQCRDLSFSSGDFVIKRADGPFAYQLAVVVDDAAAGVNQVVRGADLLTSTPRQIHLQRLLGYPLPSYCHLPLVTGPDGGKLSKRDNAVSLGSGLDLTRDGGELLLDALRFLGQDPPGSLYGASCGEILEWALSAFDPERICYPLSIASTTNG